MPAGISSACCRRAACASASSPSAPRQRRSTPTGIGSETKRAGVAAGPVRSNAAGLCRQLAFEAVDEHHAQFLGADLDRVAAGAGVGGGHLRHLVDLLVVDADLFQRVRDADLL